MGKITNKVASGAWQEIYVCGLDTYADALEFVKNKFDPAKPPAHHAFLQLLKKDQSVTFTGDPWVVFYVVLNPTGEMLFSITRCMGTAPNVNISFLGTQFLLTS